MKGIYKWVIEIEASLKVNIAYESYERILDYAIIDLYEPMQIYPNEYTLTIL